MPKSRGNFSKETAMHECFVGGISVGKGGTLINNETIVCFFIDWNKNIWQH